MSNMDNGTGPSAAVWLMRRLRKEFKLEFIYVDLSELGRWKVLEYASYIRRQEEEIPRPAPHPAA